MHLVIIGARDTGTSLYLVSLALSKGFKITIITARHDDLSHAFEKEVSIITLDITTNNVIDYIQQYIMKDRTEIAITTAHDLYASVAAQVSNKMGTLGPNADAVTHYVSKHNQQQTLSFLGCRIGNSYTISLKDSFLLSQFEHLVYPVVVKPVEGSASHGIKKCHSREEVYYHLKILEKNIMNCLN